ncbi:MAG: hypothetical protein ACKOAU_20310, partial [Pirellula sp.]
MWIFDAHLDLALNGVDWNRDLRQSVDDIRAQETTLQMTDKGRRNNTLSFPELRIAQVPDVPIHANTLEQYTNLSPRYKTNLLIESCYHKHCNNGW